MAEPATRNEFDELVREVEGEKIVTRHILEQTRRNGDDLAALKTRVARVEEKVDGVDRKVDGLQGQFNALHGQFGALQSQVGGLVKDLPSIVRDSMREVLREHDRRKK